jgi:hypothetical protein
MMDRVMDNRGRIFYICGCDPNILRALLALSDWAEWTLGNFHRELTHELNPLDGPTNRIHLEELQRFERDCWLGTGIIKNSACQNPLIVRYFRRLEKLHERANDWSHNLGHKHCKKGLRSKSFLPDLVALVKRMLQMARKCKKDILLTMVKMRS